MSESGRRPDGQGGRSRFRPLFLALASLSLVVGCRSNNKSALIEAELRTREREVRALRADLERAETLNGALQNDFFGRPGCGIPIPGGPVIDGTQAIMSGSIKNVVLGRGTGGIDDDGIPGDEALGVVIVPQDSDGSALKAPGQVIVQAYEMTPDGLKVPLSRWEVTALDLQKTWKSGFLTTGYGITLPWKSWPSTEKLRVVVQFIALPNHRPFEVDKDVAIKLPPGVPRRTATSPGTEVLPAPKTGMPAEQGPVLTPGAWFRERQPTRYEAAKPASPRSPATLLGPREREDVDIAHESR